MVLIFVGNVAGERYVSVDRYFHCFQTACVVLLSTVQGVGELTEVNQILLQRRLAALNNRPPSNPVFPTGIPFLLAVISCLLAGLAGVSPFLESQSCCSTRLCSPIYISVLMSMCISYQLQQFRNGKVAVIFHFQLLTRL